MSIKKQSEQQIYGRNDMIMLEQNNKIYGSLGLADRYVMKTEEGTRLILSNPKLGSFDDVLTEFVIYGMSKQVVTTGKNLCSIKSCQLSTNIVKSDIVLWTKSSQVYYAFDTQDISGSEAYLSIAYYNADKKHVGSNGLTIVCNGTRKTGSFNGKHAMNGSDIDLTTIEYISVQLGLYTASVVPSFIDNIMVCDEENQTYEPYTGGKPSPSPEYPQEIVSVGGNGSIGVEITGKNLFGGKAFVDEIVEIGGSLDETNKTVTISGRKLEGKNIYEFPDKTKQYTVMLSGHNLYSVQSANLRIVYEDNYKVDFLFVNGKMLFVTDKNKKPKKIIGIYYTGTTVFDYEKFGIFEGVLTETDFKSYEHQSFPIATPTGLPAIPVPSGTSGITYTDADGQAWIADEIDFGRGKYVQRVWKGVFDGSEDEEWKKGGINYIHIECLPVAMSNREGFCSQYIVGNNIRGIRIGNGNVSLIIFDDFSDENALSNFKANLSANPLKVMTYLDTPIETDITQEEIKDYQSLVTYDGTTIVENDAECYTKITYMAKGN